MNERIRELLKQATTIEIISGRGFDTTQYIDRFDKEKFAELIVEECIEQVNETMEFTWPEMQVKIRAHFG